MTSFESLSLQIIEIGRAFHSRGWVTATSGNFSAVLGRQPLRLAITVSGAGKGALTEAQIVEIDETMTVVGGPALKPSDESLLHITLARVRGAGAVLHTHSVWSTVLSRACAREAGIALEGLEMLKALEGVSSPERREWLPILDNAQDMALLARRMEEALDEFPGMHGFLVAGHGLYTWGATLEQAMRHIEALEFLLEVEVRSRSLRR